MTVRIDFEAFGAAAWTVPANIDGPLSVELAGGAGGSNTNLVYTPVHAAGHTGFGGYGGYVKGTLAVTPGEVVYMSPGGAGFGYWLQDRNSLQAPVGGTNGGGRGGSSLGGAVATDTAGASGGGMTAIYVGGTARANIVAVAAGGGGAGPCKTTRGTPLAGGSGGAATGHVGLVVSGAAPGGGTPTAGGAGSPHVGTTLADGADGTAGAGGAGGSASGTGNTGGGGGGAGWFGGGGAGDADGAGSNRGGSGAGGSNYVAGLTSVITNAQGSGGSGQVYGIPNPIFGANGFGPNASDQGGIIVFYAVLPNSPYFALYTPDYFQTTDFDETKSLNVFISHSSDDGDDVPSDANVRWRVGSGAWTTITGLGPSVRLGSRTWVYAFVGGTFTAYENTAVELQSRTASASGSFGPWSTSLFLTPRPNPTDPAIVAPAPDLTSASSVPYEITNTVGMNALQVALMPAGVTAPPTGTEGSAIFLPTKLFLGGTLDYIDSQNVTPGAAPLTPGATYHFWARSAATLGVWSDWIDSGPLVADINAPLPPTATITTDSDTASVTVTVANPGSDPFPAVSNGIYRTDMTHGTPEVLVATVGPNGTWTDWFPPINIQLRYRIEAFAASGSGSSSA